MRYRPWGPLDWTLGLSSPKRWTLVGVVGTEERSLAAFAWLKELHVGESYHLFEIRDNISRHTALSERLLRERRAQLDAAGGDSRSLRRFPLLVELHEIDGLCQDIERSRTHIILDITSLPKRFFFPMLRAFSRSPAITDLLVTYTWPQRYEEEEPLVESPGSWAPLPGFLPSGSGDELLIASVGFAIERLSEHTETITRKPAIEVLIPFPSTLSSLRQSWRSVWWLQRSASPDKFANHRVSALNISLAFDKIAELVRDRSAIPAFAPFGPKTISAAMCLHAFQKGWAVYYPQPLVYHPQYSHGVMRYGNKPAVYAYWIKHNGKFLYDVNPRNDSIGGANCAL